jgi:hypothetical protein
MAGSIWISGNSYDTLQGGLLMKIARAIAWLGVAAMSAALFFGFTKGDFFADGSIILNNPWGIVSMVDLYVGFTIFSMWVFFREKSKFISILWIIAIMILGFFAGALYTAIHLEINKGDWVRFFLGWRSKEIVPKGDR